MSPCGIPHLGRPDIAKSLTSAVYHFIKKKKDELCNFLFSDLREIVLSFSFPLSLCVCVGVCTCTSVFFCAGC